MTREKFSSAYGMLPLKYARHVRNEIMKETGWNTVRFYQKKEGLRRCTPVERATVEREFRHFSIDAWTGEQLPSINHNQDGT